MKISSELKLDNLSLLRFLFILCYGYYDFGMPISFKDLSFLNFLHISVFLIALIVSTYFIFRKNTKTLQNLSVQIRTVPVWIMITLAFVFINWNVFNTFLTGDELAYTGNSWNHVLVISDRLYNSGIIIDKLNIEAKSLIQVLNIMILLALIFTAKKVYQVTQGGMWLIALAVLGLLKLLNYHVFHFSFQYLGGYTIPINLASVFSPTDLVIRIVNFSFFIFIILIGIHKKDKTNHALIASLCLLLCTATLGNSLQAIDTTIFYIAFGTVVLFRLLKPNDYELEQTIQIAAIGVFFRPANLIWVILCLVVQAKINKKGIFSKNNTVSFMALIPFLVEIFFRVIKSFRNSDIVSDISSIYYPEAGRIFAFIMSINDATDTSFLLVVLISIIALVLSRTTLYLFLVYMMLIFTLYIYMIPNGIVGHNKYPIEVLSPLAIVLFSVLLQKLSDKLGENKFWYFSAISVISIFLLYLSFNFTTKNFFTYDSKYSQRETFISYPLEVRMSLSEIQKISNSSNCVNPGVTYGKPYYVLRGESFKNLKKFHEFRQSFSDPEQFEFLFGSKDFGCVLIDLISDRERVERLLLDSGYRLKTSLRGDKFQTRFDLYIKERERQNQND